MIKIDRLIFESQTPEWAIDLLAKPHQIKWPSQVSDLRDLRDELRSRLSSDLFDLFCLSLAAHFLLSGTQRNPEHMEFLGNPGLLPEEIFTSGRSWRFAEAPVVRGGQAEKVSFLVGQFPSDILGKSWPDWMDDHLDVSSSSAITDAFQAALACSKKPCNLYTFALLPPNAKMDIGGRSLGLSIALAALSALTGEPTIKGLLATGDVSPDPPFKIRPVSEIEVKSDLVCRGGYRLFLIPDTGTNTGQPSSTIPIQPVLDLRQAWFLARLYSPEWKKDLVLMTHIPHDPKLLANNCLDIHVDLLERLLDCPEMRDLVRQMIQDQDCVQTIISKLDNCYRFNVKEPRKAAVLRTIFSQEEDFSSLKNRYPIMAFQWAVLNLKHANHCGDNATSRYWKEQANELQQECRTTKPQDYSHFLNNLCVSLHNTYTFHPDPPVEFMEALQEEERCSRGTINEVLGSMYGTLAQNYAFCGPAWLKQVVQYVNLAQDLFGQGEVLESRKDWIREYSYLVYAFLDANHIRKARTALWNYLDIQDWSGLPAWEQMQRYEQGALARYLADSSSRKTVAKEMDIAGKLLREVSPESFQPDHPNQLIAWNFGRLSWVLGNLPLAGQWLETSIRLCQCSNETIAVMTLLPLSGLHRAGLLTEDHRKIFEHTKESVRSSSFLNQEHFKELMAGPVEKVLTMVWEDAGRFFPFSSR